MTNTFSSTTALGEIGLKVTDHITAMLAYWDKDLICRFANDAYKDWFGFTKDQMIGSMHMKDLLGKLFEMNLPHIQGVLAGHRQIFEREIPLPGGGSRHSLATYTPDIENGIVQGFFVHVADVTYIKELERKLSNSKQEMLQSVIEAQENERAKIVYALNQSISQTLSYCKMVLGTKIKTDNLTDQVGHEIGSGIQKAINELNVISNNLAPSTIEFFGFVEGTNDYLLNFKFKESTKVQFACDAKIEALKFSDKVSLFRMVQSFLFLIADNQQPQMVGIKISMHANTISLRLSTTYNIVKINRASKEFNDMQYRVDYYKGKIYIHENYNEKIIVIDIKLP